MKLIVERLEFWSKAQPEAIAYKAEDSAVTYSQLWHLANKYAALLKQQGSEPVIILGHKEVDFVVSIVSCLIAKRAYVPVDINVPKNRIKEIILMTKASLVLTSYEDYDFDEVQTTSLKKISFNQSPNALNSNTTAYIIFTSGSTGSPKGIAISYNNLACFINWISNLNALKDYNKINVLSQALFSFDLSVADLYYSLYNGHTLIGLDKSGVMDLDYILNTIIKNKINLIVATPTFLKLCLLDDRFNSKQIPFISCVYMCGEVLESSTVQKLFKRFAGVKILNAYGPTEATSAVSAIEITTEILLHHNSLPVGRVFDFATPIEIINEEIVIKGDSVFDGYIGESVGGHFKENEMNCFYTGDLGKIENGKLFCLGRKDRQVKLNGYRIELDEIESHISGIDGVNNCAVIAMRSGGKVKCLKAFVSGQKINEAEIKKKLKENIPEYMIPKYICIQEDLPINSNLKIDRKAMEEKC